MQGWQKVCMIMLLLALAISARAQRFEGGVVAGFNLAQIDGDRLAGFNKIGINAGGRVGAILSDRWQLSMEFLYSQQGASRSRADDPASIYDKISLNYVEVPVMMNFKEWKFHVSGGVSYARLINFEVIDFTGVDISDQQNYNDNVFSLHLGATYYFTEKVGLEIRWFRSLNNMQADAAAGTFIGRSISTRLVYLF